MSKFQYSIKFFTATWPDTGANNRKFLENTMRQDNFRKCSRCQRFNEIFQYLINRRRNTKSGIFRQKPYSKLFQEWKI